MTKRELNRMRRIVLIACAALLLLSGVAYASIPDAGGVIHGCRKNTDGSVRVIDSDAGQTCPNGWTAFNWSQTGPQGPAGPAYLPPVGTRGTSAVSGVLGPGQEMDLRVLCWENEVVLGGGYQNRDPQNLTVVMAHDLFQQSSLSEPHGYEVYLIAGPNGSQDPLGVRVEATCGPIPQ